MVMFSCPPRSPDVRDVLSNEKHLGALATTYGWKLTFDNFWDEMVIFVSLLCLIHWRDHE